MSGTGTLVRHRRGGATVSYCGPSFQVQYRVMRDVSIALVFVSARPVQLIVIVVNYILVMISVSQGILVG